MYAFLCRDSLEIKVKTNNSMDKITFAGPSFCKRNRCAGRLVE